MDEATVKVLEKLEGRRKKRWKEGEEGCFWGS